MSRSFRDRPTWKTAELRQKTDKEGKIILPKVIQRACLKTECYPFDKRPIEKALELLPPEYIYGLKSVELWPRAGRVGFPLGVYLRPDKTIIIYSVPKKPWVFDSLGQGTQNYYEMNGVIITKGEGHSVTVEWTKWVDLAFVFYNTFLHELGHHYQFQYRTKKKFPVHSVTREAFADMFSQRMWEQELFHVWQTTKNGKRRPKYMRSDTRHL